MGSATENVEEMGTASRVNPVAQEIPVNATGTRPGEGVSKRELFTEETNTVLVFPDGAVIRLAAAVATGQLIFLTNKNTKKEVVCQVVGKRSYRPTSCYVELQFTEAMPEFWGIEFPSAELEPVTEETAVTAGLVECAEETEDTLSAETQPPSEHEVEQLREEVEVLRKQLREMKPVEVSANPELAPLELVEEPVEAERAVPAEEPNVEAASSVEATSGVEIIEAVPEELRKEPLKEIPKEANIEAPVDAPIVRSSEEAVPWPKDWPKEPVAEPAPEGAAASVESPAEARSSHVAMQLPTRARDYRELSAPQQPRPEEPKSGRPKLELPPNDPEADLLDELLPKPSLDFSKAPIRRPTADGSEPYSIYKPERKKLGKVTLGILAATLIASIGFGAWQLGLVSRLKGIIARKPKPVIVEASKQVVPPKLEEKVDAPTTPTVPLSSPGIGNAPAATDGNSDASPLAVEAEKKTEEIAPAPVPAVEARKQAGVVSQKKAPKLTSREKVAAPNEHGNSTVEAAPSVTDVPLVPAKLLKAVPPVYPPEAMRSFITGDVKLKAEVDENGKVRNPEIVSGPAALRAAAADALKQYQYAAATRGGRGVASEVKVTIKFWFDP